VPTWWAPLFFPKAARVLDLYAGCWEGKPLGDDVAIPAADELIGIPAFQRLHPPLPPGPSREARHEFE
jgi:hypothetical protein